MNHEREPYSVQFRPSSPPATIKQYTNTSTRLDDSMFVSNSKGQSCADFRIWGGLRNNNTLCA